jgi:hypothetical protein
VAYLNASIPPIECYVRGNYLRNQEDSHDKFFNCIVFGVASVPNRSPLFHFIMQDGGVWWRAPISAFCSKKDAPVEDLNQLVLWDSFSYYISVNQFYALKNAKMQYLDRQGHKKFGRYLFTLDWAHPEFNEINFGYSETPNEHKCGHVIELDNGNYAIQPNNRIKVFDASFVTKPNEILIERKVSDHIYTVEDSPKWHTEDNNNFDYKMKEIK